MIATRSTDPWAGASTIGVADARTWILEQLRCGQSAPTPLAESDGLVLGEDAVAGEASPPFDTSAMDGYAVHYQPDASSTWRIVGRAFAGNPFHGAVGDGQAVRIMTGARVPAGTHAVLPLEVADDTADGVRATAPIEPGANIRRRGSDHHAGDVIFPAGTRLGAAHVAVLASIGVDHPKTVKRARVGVMSTGDELTAATTQASIRDTNRPGLLALVRADGAVPVDLGVAPDDPQALRDRIGRAVRDCDAVITTGGVSVGDHDHVKRVLAEMAVVTGGVARWMRVAVRPAKPLMFATISGVPVFGLPGNPASAFVSFDMFVRPALDVLAGDTRAAARRSFRATAAVDLTRREDGRVHVVAVVAEIVAGRVSIRPVGGQGGHHLASTAAANAHAYVPDGPTLLAGSLVDCTWLTGPLGADDPSSHPRGGS